MIGSPVSNDDVEILLSRLVVTKLRDSSVEGHHTVLRGSARFKIRLIPSTKPLAS